MYLITLTKYIPNGIYADDFVLFKWVAPTEEEANIFMERIVNILDMESGLGSRWTKEVMEDDDEYELALEVEKVAVSSPELMDDLERTLAAYVSIV